MKTLYEIDKQGYLISNIEIEDNLTNYNKRKYIDIPPPNTQPNEIVKWNGTSWEVVINYKGKTVYNKTDGSEYKNPSYSLNSGYTDIPPNVELPAKFDDTTQTWTTDIVGKAQITIQNLQQDISEYDSKYKPEEVQMFPIYEASARFGGQAHIDLANARGISPSDMSNIIVNKANARNSFISNKLADIDKQEAIIKQETLIPTVLWSGNTSSANITTPDIDSYELVICKIKYANDGRPDPYVYLTLSKSVIYNRVTVTLPSEGDTCKVVDSNTLQYHTNQTDNSLVEVVGYK